MTPTLAKIIDGVRNLRHGARKSRKAVVDMYRGLKEFLVSVFEVTGGSCLGPATTMALRPHCGASGGLLAASPSHVAK
jgi:hypothetical protein